MVNCVYVGVNGVKAHPGYGGRVFYNNEILSKCSNLIYPICELIFEAIPARSEGEYKYIRLSDKSEAAKKKPQIG